MVALGPEAPRAAEPPGFAGRLRPPQATLLHAMLELERPGPLLRRSGRICEPFSFGKTALFVALVCASRRPPRRPVLVGEILGGILCACRGERLLPRLALRYARVLPTTLVVVPPSVVGQWQAEVARFAPALRVAVVDNVWALRRFEQALARRETFDLVVVKCGQVTPNYRARSEAAGSSLQASRRAGRSLAEALQAAACGSGAGPVSTCWARLVWDDFDSANVPSAALLPPALFTWLVSPSGRRLRLKSDNSGRAFRSGSLAASYHDQQLRIFAPRCEEAYASVGTRVPRPSCWRLVLPGGSQLLRALGVSPRTLELVGGEALAAAGGTLEHCCSSVQELERQLLQALAERLARARATVEAHARAAADPSLKKVPERALGPARKTMREAAARLQRLRRRLAENQCPLCLAPPAAAFFVYTCCQCIVCAECLGLAGRALARTCPLCKQKSALLVVPHQADQVPHFAGAATAAQPSSKTAALCQLLARAPLAGPSHFERLCRDQHIDFGPAEPPPGLLGDSGELVRRPDDRPWKVLVFTMQPESAAALSKALASGGTEFLRLQGTPRQKTRTVALFRGAGPRVMLIVGMRDCAGLDIPEATHVVFFHHFEKEVVFRQLAGRAQRSGRDHSLEVLFLCHPNEVGAGP